MRALVVSALVLVGTCVVADRIAVSIAEQQVAEQITERAELAGEPGVDIPGFPFLTQAVEGRYDEVRISLDAADLGQPEGTRADVSLRGVELAMTDILSGSVQQVPVERIDGTATLSYALLSEQIGPDTTLAREGDGLLITRTVDVLGERVPLTAAGQVTLDGSDLLIDVDRASGAGVDIPESMVGKASDLLGLRYALPELPFDLQLTAVRPAEDGVTVDAEAVGTVLGG